MNFSELPEDVQAETLDKHRNWNVDGYDWWHDVLNDAVDVAVLLGLAVAAKDIKFRGFWSQGDGCVFSGYYQFVPGASNAVKAHAPQDDQLLAIANQLLSLQASVRLQYGSVVQGTIDVSPGSPGLGVMFFTMNYDPPGDVIDWGVLENEFRRLFETFANWIYGQLEAEYEHLTNDEAIVDSLVASGMQFGEDGSIL